MVHFSLYLSNMEPSEYKKSLKLYRNAFYDDIHKTVYDDHNEVMVIHCVHNAMLVVTFIMNEDIKIQHRDKYLYFVGEKCIGGILGSEITDSIIKTEVGKPCKVSKKLLSKKYYNEELYIQNDRNKRRKFVHKTEEPREVDLYLKIHSSDEVTLDFLFDSALKRFGIISNINNIRVTKNVTELRVIQETYKLMSEYPLDYKEDNISHFFFIQFIAPFLDKSTLRYYLSAERAIISHNIRSIVSRNGDIKSYLQNNCKKKLHHLTEFPEKDQDTIFNSISDYHKTLQLYHPSKDRIFGTRFEHLLERVSNRGVFMLKGYCFFDYLEEKDITVDFVIEEIKARISLPSVKEKAKLGMENWGEESFEVKMINTIREKLRNLAVDTRVIPQLKSFRRKTEKKIFDMMIRSHPPCMVNHLISLQKNRHIHYWQAVDLSSYFQNLGVPIKDIEDFFIETVSEDRIKEYRNIAVRKYQKEKRPDWGVGCETEIGADRLTGEYYYGCPFAKRFRENPSTMAKFDEIMDVYPLHPDKRAEIYKIAKGGNMVNYINACSMTCSSTSGTPNELIIFRPPDFFFNSEDALEDQMEIAAQLLTDDQIIY